MNAGALTIPVGSGRIQCTIAVPVVRAPNAIPFTTGSIVCVAPAGVPRDYVSGIPYTSNGRICIDTTGAAIARYVAGLAVTDSGQLACDTAASIVAYTRGLPQTREGRLAISPPT